MHVRELSALDVAVAVTLWDEAGLTRPWNNPVDDFHRAVNGASSTILGIKVDDEVVGTVMVGDDGHRGWVYYLAVTSEYRRMGLGAALMCAAEAWLREHGAVKIQLMVRDANAAGLSFYYALGYDDNEVKVLSRRLDK